MADGTAIDYGNSVAVNPEGTLYIAAGSASGSKFYKLATTKQYYIAERQIHRFQHSLQLIFQKIHLYSEHMTTTETSTQTIIHFTKQVIIYQ